LELRVATLAGYASIAAQYLSRDAAGCSERECGRLCSRYEAASERRRFVETNEKKKASHHLGRLAAGNPKFNDYSVDGVF